MDLTDTQMLLLVLAVLQGLTEFLPISSSGHLGLLKAYLGGGDSFDDFPSMGAIIILLHLGTLLSVLLFYKKPIILLLKGIAGFGEKECVIKQRQYFVCLLIGTLPAVIIGYFLHSLVGVENDFFESSSLIAFCLILTSIILFSVKDKQEGSSELSLQKSLLIGFAQACAILPGISRSGATIVAAQHLGIPVRKAEEFSFLLAIPVIGGGAILGLSSAEFGGLGLSNIFLALFVSAVVGFLALLVLHKVLKKRKLHWFSLYCFGLAMLVVLLR
jgi:undecaprenyl-diphosphatase